MSDEGRLVYSSDPRLNQKCAQCKELVSECVCVAEEDPKKVQFTAVLRIEKTGRGGKTVTVVDRLPRNTQFLKDLTKKLKNKCGSGGTHRIDDQYGVIEIQGDQRERIREALKKESIPHKG